MSSVTAVPLRPVKRGYLIWLWLGLALALVLAAAVAWAGDPFTKTPSGLRYQVLKPGPAGAPTPTDNDVVLVQYEGRLADGTVFDKSQQPTPFPVRGVVPGFAEGLKLMSKGSRYRLLIPPQLGYGAEAKGGIPANSELRFDVEMIDFIPEATLRQLQMQQMMGMGGPGVPPPPTGPGER